jgi:hypothetical protein
MLKEKIPAILKHIEKYFSDTVGYQRDLLNIIEGGLLPYVLAELKRELSPKAYERIVGNVPPINILLSLVDKLSTLYTGGVRRTTQNETDKELISYYEKEFDLNGQMAFGNKMLNTNKYFAIEPYLQYPTNSEEESIEPKIRILPANKFIVYSDDPVNPNSPTVFIKIAQYVNGDYMSATESMEKSIFYLYSDTEFLPINGKGEIQPDHLGESNGVNPYGVIPFVYGVASDIDLIPIKDGDTYRMSLLAPKTFGHLNYVIGFQCHSVIYGIDLNVGDIEMNPDVFWNFHSKEGETSKPAIGTIKPETDIDKATALLKEQLSVWYESKGLKVNMSGNVDNSASGVAKLLDMADATEARRKQINIFKKVEHNLWMLIEVMHKYWVQNGLIEERRLFSEEFEVNVDYDILKPVVDDKQKLEEIKMKLDMGLTSKFRAIKEANPTLTDDEINKLITEISKENQEAMKKFQDNQQLNNTDAKEDSQLMGEDNGKPKIS